MDIHDILVKYDWVEDPLPKPRNSRDRYVFKGPRPAPFFELWVLHYDNHDSEISIGLMFIRPLMEIHQSKFSFKNIFELEEKLLDSMQRNGII